MRFRSALTLAVLACCSPALAQSPSPSPAPAAPPGTVLRRATLLVHDIDKAVAFYRDAIGMSVWLENKDKSAGDLPTGDPPGTPSHFVIMKGRDPWLGMIGLLQYGDSKTARRKDTIGPGDVVLMMETSDLSGIHERVKKLGYRVVKEPRTTEMTFGDGTRGSATFLFCMDPDGHVLEINQRSPAK
jgi:catechol 2,3-dioxygenase-like lactoylglutathione lyase family enzyme